MRLLMDIGSPMEMSVIFVSVILRPSTSITNPDPIASIVCPFFINKPVSSPNPNPNVFGFDTTA